MILKLDHFPALIHFEFLKACSQRDGDVVFVSLGLLKVDGGTSQHHEE